MGGGLLMEMIMETSINECYEGSDFDLAEES